MNRTARVSVYCTFAALVISGTAPCEDEVRRPLWTTMAKTLDKSNDRAIVVDESIMAYLPTERSLMEKYHFKILGSSVLDGLMNSWAIEIQARYPNVTLDIEGGTTPLAVASAIEHGSGYPGNSFLYPMVRDLKNTEVSALKRKWPGRTFFVLPLCWSGIVIYSHKDNPVVSLTLPQIDGIFSRHPHRRSKNSLSIWGDVGLGSDWSSKKIIPWVTAKGTAFKSFQGIVMMGGALNDEAMMADINEDVIKKVMNDNGLIQAAPFGADETGLKAISIKVEESIIEPTRNNVFSGRYPAGELLVSLVVSDENGKIGKATAAFFRYVYSLEGQRDVVKQQAIPLPSEFVTICLNFISENAAE